MARHAGFAPHECGIEHVGDFGLRKLAWRLRATDPHQKEGQKQPAT
jgi:hypothetical protein